MSDPVDQPLVAGRYRLTGLLGHGGTADVHRAVDTTNGRVVAVKLLRSTDPALARRLSHEAKALRQLHHPNLVGLLDAGVADDGRGFLVVELVEGSSLAASLTAGPRPPATVAAVAAEVADALAAVHAAGIVHRDVKPGNILLDADGHARLADFGIASLADASMLTATGTTLGTAAYMAPEQLEHHAVGPAADVWSLGLVLLECLVGRRLYEGRPAEVVARRLAGPVPLPDDLPAPWRLLLGGMLDHDPRRRPSAPDVAALVAAPAFATPWAPSTGAAARTGRQPAAEPGAGPHELTPSAMGPSPAAAGGSVGATTLAATVAATAVDDATRPLSPPTEAASPDPTVLGPTIRSVWRRPSGRTVAATAVTAALVIVVLAVLLGGGAPHHTSATRHRARTTTPPHSSTSSSGSSGSSSASSSSSPTTTTTTEPATAAAATTLTDLGRDLAGGALSPDQATALVRDVGAAVLDAADGNTTAADNALTSAEDTVAKAFASGNLSTTEDTQLVDDLATLASALGLPTPTVPTTSTSSTPGPAGPPAGNGGPGNGGPGNGGPGKNGH